MIVHKTIMQQRLYARYYGLLSLTLGALMAQSARAQLSPGELAKAHAELEGLTNCTSCHELGKGTSAEKCLTCHSEIKNRLKGKKGFHNQVVNIEKKTCFACHSEHNGREHQLIRWPQGQGQFDHNITGYQLEGAHGKLQCRQCHIPPFVGAHLTKESPHVNLTNTFLGLQQSCLNCHHDEHRDQLNDDCAKCHSYNAWLPAAGFDHSKTRFNLVGAHKKVKCSKCHKQARTNAVYSPDGRTDPTYLLFGKLEFKNCLSCHTDPHGGELGSSCLKCHTQNAWRPASNYDHSKTRFPLTGKHASVECNKCHNKTKGRKSASRFSGKKLHVRFSGLKFDNCSSCHLDAHSGKLNSDCKSCHGTSGWDRISKGKFSHKDTQYPLVGKHSDLKCNKCHQVKGTGTKKTWSSSKKFKQCADCHKDIHRGQFADRKAGNNCESCHNEEGFVPALFTIASHNDSRFRLEGAHLAQPCLFCHMLVTDKSGKKYRRFRFKRTNCNSCHKDVHGGQFTAIAPKKTCETCHSVSEWSDLKFDHNKDALFALEGKHALTQCFDCHKKDKKSKKGYIRYRPLPHECRDCHSLKTLELLGK